MPSKSMISTHIPELDEALGGGFRRGTGGGFYGSLGLGKSITSMQIAYNAISNGKTCSYHTHDQPEDMFLENMKSFGWDPEPYLDKFQIIDFFQTTAISLTDLDTPSDVNLEELLSQIVDPKNILSVAHKKMNEHFGRYPDIIIVDSATPLYMQLGGRKLYFLMQMAKKLFSRNTVTIVVLHSDVVDDQAFNSCYSLSDFFLWFTPSIDERIKISVDKCLNITEKRSLEFSIKDDGINIVDKLETKRVI